jgi:transposase
MEALNQGMKKATVCRVFNVCKQTLYNWTSLEKKQGHLAPVTGFQKGHSHKITDMNAFRSYVDKHADHTLIEIGEHFNMSRATAGRLLQKLGYSRKKRAKPTLNARKKNGKPTKKYSEH